MDKRREKCALFYVYCEKLLEAKKELQYQYSCMDSKLRTAQINFWSEERDLWYNKMADLMEEGVLFRYGKRAEFKGGVYGKEKEELK